MRNLKISCRLAVVVMVVAGIFSCNQDLGNCPSAESEIPITISDHSRIQTRVIDNAFEEHDRVGLYVVEQPLTLSDERHVDNVCFQFQDNSWIGESKIYYPTSTGKYDFIAYYPYNSEGLSAASSVYTFRVEADQRMKENYSKSDFLVAEERDIVPSVEPVSLFYKHKLVEIIIELIPDANYDSIEELLGENPEVIIKEAATEVKYDFISGEFSDENAKSEINPFGTFMIKNGKLAGVSAILVPQTIAADKVFIEVKAGSKTYGFTFGDSRTLNSSTRETYTLTIRKNSSLEGTIESTIEDWENDTNLTGDLIEMEDKEQEGKNYEILLPDFSSSSVYKVIKDDKLIAEICREYLKGTNINNQAVVVYPFVEGELDYTKGFVAQVLEEYAGSPVSETVHGGIVSWNITANTFTYQQGSSTPVSKVYIDGNGEITGNSLQNALSVTAVADMIEDERDSQPYSVVKIGSQYWMQENLKVTSLRNGGTLTNATDFSTWTNIQSKSPIVTVAYCWDWQNKSILYNFAAVQSSDLTPEGWRVPSSADWNKLKAYTNDVTTLLSLNWETGNNLSGLSVEGYGYRSKSGEEVKVHKAYFWSNTETRFEITETVNLTSASSKADGNNIRCIRN